MLNKVWFRTGIALVILFVLIKLFMEVQSVFAPYCNHYRFCISSIYD